MPITPGNSNAFAGIPDDVVMKVVEALLGRVMEQAKAVKEGYQNIRSSPNPVGTYFNAARDMASDYARRSFPLLFPSEMSKIANLPPEQRQGKIAESAINSYILPLLEVGPLYHGSPYKFTNFANEKIGTGEGAQAFGYGHYLSESQDIGKSYAQPIIRLSGGEPIDRQMVDLAKIENLANIDVKQPWGKQNVIDAIDDRLALIQGFKPVTKPTSRLGEMHSYEETLLNKIKDNIEKTGETGLSVERNLYQTTVNKGLPSSEDVFLEWDKPISPDLRKAIESKIASKDNRLQIFPSKGYVSDSPTGEQVYKAMTDIFGEEKASNFLSKVGITGIKYPSGTLSGIKDSPYYNYVIFDPKRISIDKINDVPVSK